MWSRRPVDAGMTVLVSGTSGYRSQRTYSKFLWNRWSGWSSARWSVTSGGITWMSRPMSRPRKTLHIWLLILVPLYRLIFLVLNSLYCDKLFQDETQFAVLFKFIKYRMLNYSHFSDRWLICKFPLSNFWIVYTYSNLTESNVVPNLDADRKSVV